MLALAALRLMREGADALRGTAAEDRRLIVMSASTQPESTYRSKFRGVFCNDTDSLLFDNLEMGNRDGFRIQAECEEQCNKDFRCHFMMWGWSPRGYYHCRTFITCTKRSPYNGAEATVFRRTVGGEEEPVDKEPHAIWIGGAYTKGNDPLTMEFCSLGESCDYFGHVAPLPSGATIYSDCKKQGGQWCSVHPPLDDLFSPVDGGHGRACRRTSENDDSRLYYHIKKLDPESSFVECQGLCLVHGGCTGIEHIAFRKEHRCEIWQMRIMATLPLQIATCIRHVNWLDAPNCCLKGSCGACEQMGKLGTLEREGCEAQGGQWCDPRCRWYGFFAPVDGGIDRACRGAEPWDNDASYYEVRTLQPKEDITQCKHLCLDMPHCKGIEFSEFASAGPQCKLWTRTAGIGAAQHAEGAICLRWQS